MIETRALANGEKRYKVRIKSAGKLIASRTFARKADAIAWEGEQTRALRGGVLIDHKKAKTPLREVGTAFMDARTNRVAPHTLRTDRDNLASLPPRLLDRPIGAIQQADVVSALTGMLKARAHSTVARTRTTLSALMTWAVEERYIATNPVRGARLPAGSKPKVKPFTAETLERTLTAQRDLSPHYASITEFLSLCGIRWSEARALHVADLHTDPYPSLHVAKAQSDGYDLKGPKSDRGYRAVPLTDRAFEIAQSMIQGKKPTDYLLTTKTGRQLRGNLFRRYTGWSTTASGHTLHHLRHYAASSWLRAGVPVNQVAEWLGDDPRTVLSTYAHVLGEQQNIEALKRLNRQPGPPRDPRASENDDNDEDEKGGKPRKIPSDQGINGGDGGI